ncbi:MAG: BrnA antitoxin family protein [Terriglobales bacterium]
MKKRKRVTRRRVQKKAQKKISRLQASAGGGMRPIPALPEWPGYYRPIKKAITLRLDADVLAWFQRQGRGYQTRINRALRKLMMDERKGSGE